MSESTMLIVTWVFCGLISIGLGLFVFITMKTVLQRGNKKADHKEKTLIETKRAVMLPRVSQMDAAREANPPVTTLQGSLEFP
jgi:hypothetical protein